MASTRTPAGIVARSLMGVVLLAGGSGPACGQGWQGPPPGVTRDEPARSTGGAAAHSAVVEQEPVAPVPEEAPMEPIDETHSGELTEDDPVLPADGSVYDAYGFEAVVGASIVVVLRSDDFEPYLHLIGPGGSQLVHGGESPGGQGVAEIAMAAPASGLYQVYANALEPTMRGGYRLRIVALPPPRPAARPTSRTEEPPAPLPSR